MSGGVRRTAPVVLHSAMRKMLIYFARMHCAARSDKLEQLLRPLSFGAGQWQTNVVHRNSRLPRMHQRMQRGGHKAIRDKEVFFDVEGLVTSLEFTSAIMLYPMPQDQILGPR